MSRENVKLLTEAVKEAREAIQMSERDMESANSRLDKVINMLQKRK